MKLRDHTQQCNCKTGGSVLGHETADGGWCPGGKEITLVPAGSVNEWFCRNCGGDHGDAGCDDPDFGGVILYRIMP